MSNKRKILFNKPVSSNSESSKKAYELLDPKISSIDTKSGIQNMFFKIDKESPKDIQTIYLN